MGEKILKKIDKVIEILISILFISIFIDAKGVFNIGVLLIIIIGVLKVVKTKKYNEEQLFFWYLSSLFIGIIANLRNGTIKDFLSNERSLWYFLIFILINLKIEQYEKLKKSIFYSGLVSALYSGISYFTPNFFGINTLKYSYESSGRMPSFTNVIRWGSLLQILSSFSFIKLLGKKSLTKNVLYFFTILLFLGNILINGTRAGMLGIFGAYLFLLISLLLMFRMKVIRYLVPLILMVSLFISYLGYKNPGLKERVLSITSTTNPSNRIRLDFYKIGWDILKENPLTGHGSKKSKEVFKEFINKQSTEYKEKYYNNSILLRGGTPFENNYINLAIENGIIYVFYTNFVLLLIFIKILISIKNKVKILIILATILGNKIFVFFFPGTDSYVEFIICYLIFYAYKLTEENNGIEREIKC